MAQLNLFEIRRMASASFFFLSVTYLVAFHNKWRLIYNNYSYNHFKSQNINLLPYNPEEDVS